VSQLRGALAVAAADFLDRVRRHRTLVTTAAMVYAAHIFLPPIGARHITLQLDDFRPLYGSAYVGMLCAILCSSFLTLAGFYVVKDAVDRDRTTRVGEILASTPLSRIAYVTGKWLSNVTLLGGMLVVVLISAGVLQVLRAEDPRLDLAALVAPFVWIAFPALAVTASAAVFFEVTPGLRGGLGNVVYPFLWAGLLQVSGPLVAERFPPPGSDFAGFTTALPSLYAAQARAYPDEPARRDRFSAGINFKQDATWQPRTFAWEGLRWDVGLAGRRAGWMASALALLGVSARVFDRFQRGDEPARRRRRRRGSRAEAPSAEAAVPIAATTAITATTPRAVHLTALPAGALLPKFAPLAVQEFVLLLKGTSRWWWVPLLGLTVAALLLPLPAVLEWILPMLWIWPLLHWSSLGAREQRHATIELMLSAPRPVLRPVMAAWTAGAALAIVLAFAVMVRVVLAGAWPQLAGLVAGACFIPAFALALGTWTGSGKLFEVLYMLLWYMATNRVPGLDYTGGSAATGSPPLVWAALAAGMLALALVGRARLARR
jgi:hypothetical protein